jgi:cell division protease FtsH
MSDREPLRPDDSSTSRFSKNGAFWLLLVLISILAFQFIRGQDTATTDFTYSEFKQQLAARNISEVTVYDGRRIEGELKAPHLEDGQEYERFSTILPGVVSDELVTELEAGDVEISGDFDRGGWGTILLGALPWLLFIAFWIWIFRTMQGGGNRAFQFGRSKAKLISPDTPKVKFSDVAGADEAKEELEEIIEFLKDPQRFARLGGRLPKGVLLVGPPGTGKTLLAKAVAGEAERPFFQMSGSDFVEMFVGVGASRVRDLFEQGKAHAPCIIFIDEIDAVGRHRGAGLGGGHDEREQTLNALLVEMDGFEANEGVILLSATNRPDVLDPALLRPGRFDRQVVVDSPDIKGREGILRVHAKKLPLDEDVVLKVIAKGTPGLSGADLANICNEAALLAARDDTNKVTMQHFERAKDKVMLGAERKSLVLTEKERKLTAYHEAGHAVVGLRLDGLDPLHKITIVPRGRALGITASLPTEDRHTYTKEWLEGQLCMLYGGRVAEEMIFGPKKVTTGAGNDIERATTMARRMVTRFGMSDAVGLIAVGDAEQEIFLGRELVQRREISDHTAALVDTEIKRILDEAHDRAREVIEDNKDLLEAIARALLDRETLDSTAIGFLDRGEELPGLVIPEDAAERGEASDKEEAPGASKAAPAVASSKAEGGESDSVPEPAVRMTGKDPEADTAG